MSEEAPNTPKRSSSRLTSAYAPPVVAPRETTLGGVQKTKFAPVVAPRKKKEEPEAVSAANTEPVHQQNPPRHQRGNADRGRGRGRGGRGGLLGNRGAPSAPVAISGPFSLGPQAAASKGRSGGPSMFTAPSAGRGRGVAGPTRRTANLSSPPSGHTDDDNLMDLERMMELEALNLGHDHTPVYLGTDTEAKSKKIESPETSFTVSDLLESLHGAVGLIQLPPRLPKVKSASSEQNDADEEKPEDSPQCPEGAEGLYGKLLVHASGKVSLEIDGVRFNLEAGENPADLPHVSACQSLVAIDPEYEQSFELGQITHCLIASPNLSQFL